MVIFNFVKVRSDLPVFAIIESWLASHFEGESSFAFVSFLIPPRLQTHPSKVYKGQCPPANSLLLVTTYFILSVSPTTDSLHISIYKSNIPTMAQTSTTPQFDTTSKKLEDVRNDIAQNYCRERMQVGSTSRMTYQKILVRSTNVQGGKTTIMYNAATDASKESIESILPTNEETAEKGDRVGLRTMLVVGLVIAQDPDKYVDSGSVKAKEKEERRKARGILPRPSKVLRAVVQVAEPSKSSFKYYVAIKPIDGLCELRLITFEKIFFFPEFLTSLNDKSTLRFRRDNIPRACRAAAAAAISEDVQAEGDGVIGSIDQDLEMSDAPTETAVGSSADVRYESEDLQSVSTNDLETFTVKEARFMLQALEVSVLTSSIVPRLTRYLQIAHIDSPLSPATIVKVRQMLQSKGLLERLAQKDVLPPFLKEA